MFTCLSELLYSLQFLEGDCFSTAWRGQDFSLFHYQLHRWTLHGARPGPSRGLTLAGGLGEGLARSAPMRSRERIEQPPGSSDCMLRLSELSILYLVPMFHFFISRSRLRRRTSREGLPVPSLMRGNTVPDSSIQSRTFDLKLSCCVSVAFFRGNHLGPFIEKYTKMKIFKLNGLERCIRDWGRSMIWWSMNCTVSL